MQFPTIVYKKGGFYRDVKSGVAFSCIGVKDEEELDIQLKKGCVVDLQSLIDPLPPKPAVKKAEPADDGEDYTRFEELSEEDIEGIISQLRGGINPKKVRTEYNIHHLTLKKIKASFELD